MAMGEVLNIERKPGDRSIFHFKKFQKVLKISGIYRFGGRCILKNPGMSKASYRNMGQGMGQQITHKRTTNF